MYSPKLEALLKKAKASISNEVTLTTKGKAYNGIIMPRPDMGDVDFLILKLNNGYNVGLKYEPTMKITKGKSAPARTEKEASLELGRRKETLKVGFDKSKPPISIITTGGTITSRVDYKTGGVTSLMNPDELLSLVPELSGIVNLKNIVRPFTIMSEDMASSDWAEIAEAAAKELNSGDKGVIITHGTDVLHYTAAAMSFMLKTTKPIVLVGAQRSSDRGSGDAAQNLLCAARVAVSDIAEVGICMHGSMNDDYCNFIRGTHVRKMHTSRRDAFQPINGPALAKVWPDGKIEVLNAQHKKRADGKTEADTKFDQKVALIKTYPGAEPDIIDYLVSKGMHGIVIEATGLGQVPGANVRDKKRNWLPHIGKAVKDGVAVAFAAQTIYGRLDPYVYSEARLALKEGVIYCEDMLSETAYVKLGFVLAHAKDAEEVRKLMLTNIAGEISQRTVPQAYYK